MISHLLLLACSLLVIGRSVYAMNHMGPKTSHGVRIAYGLIALAGVLLFLAVCETPMGIIPWFKVWLVLGATGLFVILQPLLLKHIRRRQPQEDHHARL